ncbi:hypothetical protein AAFF_G00228910 [Aldrovandia affinis]|uniref:Uncharacterized protein n=1 Tax=Aldrovandia affinis TaxID=143900 RepID=A0AAD7SVK8_9TELE|nr:hypothetical protein AAFF_G00228910 [Aldrovandia affinis]
MLRISRPRHRRLGPGREGDLGKQDGGTGGWERALGTSAQSLVAQTGNEAWRREHTDRMSRETPAFWNLQLQQRPTPRRRNACPKVSTN